LVAFVKECCPLNEDTIFVSLIGENIDFSFKIPHCTFLAFNKDGSLLATAQEDAKKKKKIYF
jgi:hypothetical protein